MSRAYCQVLRDLRPRHCRSHLVRGSGGVADTDCDAGDCSTTKRRGCSTTVLDYYALLIPRGNVKEREPSFPLFGVEGGESGWGARGSQQTFRPPSDSGTKRSVSASTHASRPVRSVLELLRRSNSILRPRNKATSPTTITPEDGTACGREASFGHSSTVTPHSKPWARRCRRPCDGTCSQSTGFRAACHAVWGWMWLRGTRTRSG